MPAPEYEELHAYPATRLATKLAHEQIHAAIVLLQSNPLIGDLSDRSAILALTHLIAINQAAAKPTVP